MIEIKHLCKSYDHKVIYNDWNGSIKEHEITCIMGPSGCGKTTLLRLLAGLEEFEGGEVRGLEEKRIAFVFQENRLMPWLTVRENIAYVLESTHTQDQQKVILDEIISRMRLSEVQKQLPTTLSGGMKQRVALGRALAYGGDLLLMDEPFKELDITLKDELIDDLLAYWNEKRPTIICVTHDIQEARRLGGEVLEIRKVEQRGNN